MKFGDYFNMVGTEAYVSPSALSIHADINAVFGQIQNI